MRLLTIPLILLAAMLHMMLPVSPLFLDPDLARLILIELRLPRTLIHTLIPTLDPLRATHTLGPRPRRRHQRPTAVYKRVDAWVWRVGCE